MINRGIIFDIKKFAIHDGPGIRSTVFFQGCPLDCPWCHNPEGINFLTCRDIEATGKIDEYNSGCRSLTALQLFSEIEKDRIFYDQSGGGVTVSGGEPLMQPGFLKKFLAICVENGCPVIVDTSGFSDYNHIERIMDLVDTFYFDLKLADEKLHRRMTGVSNLPILRNLRKLDRAGADVLPRIPLIPGFTDSEDNISKIAQILSGMENIYRVSLIPYNRIYLDKIRRFGMKDRAEGLEEQKEEDIEKAVMIFRKKGLRAEREG